MPEALCRSWRRSGRFGWRLDSRSTFSELTFESFHVGQRNARRQHSHFAFKHLTSKVPSPHALRDATKVWYLTAWWKTPVLAPAAEYARLVRLVIVGSCVLGCAQFRRNVSLTKCPYTAPTPPPWRRWSSSTTRSSTQLRSRGQEPNYGGVAKRISARHSRSLVLDRVVEGARLSWYVFHSANLACFRDQVDIR